MDGEISINGNRIYLVDNYDEMSLVAADIIMQAMSSPLNLMLSTGTSPAGVYEILRHAPDFFENTFFNLDEYCEQENGTWRLLPENHEASYRRQMREMLFGDREVESYFPTIENFNSPGTYDRMIAQMGGIDLCLNGIGEDGHTFGFNFPDSDFDSVTRKVEMNSSTRDVNEGLTGHETPDYAVTTGLKTGMGSRRVITLASGIRKAGIIRDIMYAEESTTDIPATILRTHADACWVIDREAASELRL